MHMRKQKLRKTRDQNFALPYDLTKPIVETITTWESSPRTDYLRSHLLSKFQSEDTAPPKVRRQRAINKWLAVERENEATNERLMTTDPEFNILNRVSFGQFMTTVQRIISDIVGDTVSVSALNGAFSGGATTSRQRTSSHPSAKYVGEADVSSRAKDMCEELIGSSMHDLWLRIRGTNALNARDSNVLFTVPKNTEIDRCACKEPDLSMYLQKGTGDFIRSRMRKVGIDLNNQSTNASLARQGSIDNSLATLDLSSASDSLCRELVFQVMPITWFTWLDDLRSPSTVIDGEVHVNEMFSSMGNGFTFELESLIFYALARATAYHMNTRGVISVYGDDLIVPVDIAQDLIYVLSYVGFTVNTDKTFIDGPIRESCGGHYYNGRDITPFFIRRPVKRLVDCIQIANQLRRWAILDSSFEILNCEVQSLWEFLASFVPKDLWGGHDFDDTSRLVSAWRPDTMRRLRAFSTPKSTGVGGYLHWHDSAEGSQSNRIVSYSERLVNTQSYGKRPVREPFTVTRYWFLKELIPTLRPLDAA